jgi:hypothetical protein
MPGLWSGEESVILSVVACPFKVACPRRSMLNVYFFG